MMAEVTVNSLGVKPFGRELGMRDYLSESCLSPSSGIRYHPIMQGRYQFAPKAKFAVVFTDSQSAELVIVRGWRFVYADGTDRR
jgi:hypothetical protein